jgi:hypothetical protein
LAPKFRGGKGFVDASDDSEGMSKKGMALLIFLLIELQEQVVATAIERFVTEEAMDFTWAP